MQWGRGWQVLENSKGSKVSPVSGIYTFHYKTKNTKWIGPPFPKIGQTFNGMRKHHFFLKKSFTMFLLYCNQAF